MERTTISELNANDRNRFRIYIEGCIPDLFEASDGDVDMSSEEARDNIRDYAADRAADFFPNVDVLQRSQVIDWVCDYYCGKQEIDGEGEKFSISALYPGGGK